MRNQFLESIIRRICEEPEITTAPNLDVPYNKKKGYHEIDSQDFVLRYDIVGDSLQLMWIRNRTNRIKGLDIFKQLVKYAQSINMDDIYGWWVDGTIDKVPATGYYIGMKWGFMPVDGIKFVNKQLKTNYPDMTAAHADPNFLPMWKAKGRNFTGEFDLKPGSLSLQILSKL